MLINQKGIMQWLVSGTRGRKVRIMFTICPLHVSLNFFSRVHATLHDAMLVRRLVGWSVGRLVGPLHLFLIAYFAVSRLAESHYCPCPTARDWASRVSGIVIRKKSRSQSSTFLHIPEKQGFHFLMGKLRV